jgi:hypothetical protein
MINFIKSDIDLKLLYKNKNINIIVVHDTNNGSCNKIYEYISNLNLPSKINYQIIKSSDTLIIDKHINLLFVLNYKNIINNIINKKNYKINSNIHILNLEKQNNISDYLNINRYHPKPNSIEKEFISKITSNKSIKLKDIINILDITLLQNRKTFNSYLSCPICFENVESMFISNKLCQHQLCIKCCTGILNTNKKCPFCRMAMDLDQIIVMKKYIPSFYDVIATILDDLINIDNINNINNISKSNNIVIYVNSNHIHKLADRLNYLDNIIELPDESQINIVNLNNLTNFIITSNNRIISKIKHITDIICLSNNDSIIKDNKSYGFDFINKKSKVNLHIIDI